MLKPFLLFSAVILLVIAASTPAPTLAAGSTPQDAAPAPAAPASTNPVKPTAASQAKAKKLYAIDCAMCHGDNGDGKTDLATDMKLTLLDWTDPKSLASKSDKELFDMIRVGKDKMPPEDPGRAKDDEVWNLVLYIRGMSKAQATVAAKPGN
jgi:mono/diheme cytochrome c family protein